MAQIGLGFRARVQPYTADYPGGPIVREGKENGTYYAIWGVG